MKIEIRKTATPARIEKGIKRFAKRIENEKARMQGGETR
jgi:hypothetical protein